MVRKTKRPKGWRKFDGLARTLVRVPKEDVDRRVAEHKRRKK